MNVKTSDLRNRDVVSYYGAKFVVLTDAEMVRDWKANQRGATDTSLKAPREEWVYAAKCVRVDENITGLDDILDDLDTFQGTDIVKWQVKRTNLSLS